MGAQIGDIFLGLDGKILPEIKRENADEINAVFQPSFLWEANKEFSITVKRNGEMLTLTGTLGTPTAKVNGIVEDVLANEAAVTLRKAWLFK